MGPRKSGIQLSATQIAASVLAAITATVAGSFLGVNGTIIGAAVASVVTVVGNAVYSHSIHRTRERVLTVPAVRRMAPLSLTAGVGEGRDGAARRDPVPPSDPAAPSRPDTPPRAVRGWWRRAGLASAAVFVTLLTLLTGVEVVSGRPLTDLLHGTAGSGTTVFGSSQQATTPIRPTSPAPVTVTQTVVPKVVTTTPTVTQTAPAVTVTPTPAPTTSIGTSTTTPPAGATGVPTP